MAFETEFLDMMPATVQIAPWSAYAGPGYAKPTFGADVSYQCRIELKDEYVRSHEGREILARGKIYLATTTTISDKDRVTLPAGYVPANPPILAVQPQQDEFGMHHVTLVIG